jgi:hypothetical protein
MAKKTARASPASVGTELPRHRPRPALTVDEDGPGECGRRQLPASGTRSVICRTNQSSLNAHGEQNCVLHPIPRYAGATAKDEVIEVATLGAETGREEGAVVG